jgi:hypothetical protein
MLPANLPALQEKLPANTVTLSPISGADMFYTDGLASAYQYRLEIKEGNSIKYSAYINTKEFVSCNLLQKDNFSHIVQNWLSAANQSAANQIAANQSAANQSAANQTLTQTTPPNPSLRQSHK